MADAVGMSISRRVLFIDAFDSFSNNIISLLECIPGVSVRVIKVNNADFLRADRLNEGLLEYDAVVCGPGPGTPDNEVDVGIMRALWELGDAGMHIPVLGICLGFQSMGRHFGGKIRRLRGGLHGMVRKIEHAGIEEGPEELKVVTENGENIFAGVEAFRATLYHSLCVDIGQDDIPESVWSTRRWQTFPMAPELIPLAWHTEPRADGPPERILMGFKHHTRPLWGLQYHPESACTERRGDQVIINWIEAATRWNQRMGRVVVHSEECLPIEECAPGDIKARLSHGVGRTVDAAVENLKVAAVRYVVERIPLPEGVEIPELLEAVQSVEGEQIVLDSSNHGVEVPPGSTDVRGEYSIVALDIGSALRFEYRVGDQFLTVSSPASGTSRMRNQVRVKFDSHCPDVWHYLNRYHLQHSYDDGRKTAFYGGFMGYLTYELGLENINVPLPHTVGKDSSESRPHHRLDLCFIWVTKSMVVNHREGWIDIQELIYDETSDYDTSWATQITNKLQSSPAFNTNDLVNSKSSSTTSSTNLSLIPSEETLTKPNITVPQHTIYSTAVKACQSLIAAGESYELCLTAQTKILLPATHPTSLSRDAPRWQMFRTLRAKQPAPFGSYIRLGPATLISSSPERFLNSTAKGLCTMRPMKGTVRKSSAVRTLADATALLHVPKEIAENLMIVDLVRHDLQGVCAPGKVAATKLMEVEEYASVFTMVTVIEAQLPEHGGVTALDALKASFPPGSMTGAPKMRSCELLAKIEGGQERSLYSGVVGYMCVSGRADWSVTIRSLFSWDDEKEGDMEVWRVGAGGAVTGLSTADGETEEMYLKLAGPLGSLEAMKTAGVEQGGTSV